MRPSTASSSSTAPQADTSPKIASSPHKLRKVGEFDSSPRASQLTGSTTLDTFAIAQTKDANSQPSSPSSARRALEGGPKTSPKVRYVPERVKDADSPPSSPTSACRIGEGEPRASLETLQNEKMEEDPKISPKLLQKEKPTTLPSQTDSEEKHESKHEITAEIKREIKPEGKRKGPVPEKLHLGPFPITPDPPSPRNRTASQSSVEPRTHLQPLLPPHSHSLARNARHRGASETSNASDDSRRVSFDSTSMLSDALEHIPRKSMDSRRPTIQMMDEHNPQTPSLVPPITPLSMSSMRSEAAEVSEAKAINLYPHNNHSLLVIQHGGPPEAQPNHGIPPDAIQEDVHRIGTPVQPADVQRAIDALDAMEGSLTSSPTPPPVPIATASQTEDILHLTPPHSAHAERPPQAPQLLVHPSTPPSNKQSFGEVDSPLRNPRKPPQPPAVKLIPPTPFSEIDSPLDSAGEAHGRSQAPPRRISLAQRARRYSDSFIQPILSRTGSLKRNISMTRSRPGTADEQDRRTKDHRLHPLWRPRGFWDDFSDSDSDEFWGDGELMYDDGTEHRLPQGGDTSDVRSLEHDRRGRPKAGRFDSVRRVMDGFRGSGGFLIGNSLGMERAGTNRRRHHISLPAKLQGRSSTGADANVGVPRVARVAPPSHVNDYNGATAAHLEASSHQQPRNSTLSAPHSANATQPLSLRSRSASRSRSRSGSMSLSSFPSSYSSSGHSIRKGWRRSVKFPFRIEYVGFSGLAERMREKKAEKRREDLRRSIGRGVLVTNGLA